MPMKNRKRGDEPNLMMHWDEKGTAGSRKTEERKETPNRRNMRGSNDCSTF